jgi:hypothetical protein
MAVLVVGLGLGFRGWTDPGLLGVSMTSILGEFPLFEFSCFQCLKDFGVLRSKVSWIS